jgi:hypothetical protein
MEGDQLAVGVVFAVQHPADLQEAAQHGAGLDEDLRRVVEAAQQVRQFEPEFVHVQQRGLARHGVAQGLLGGHPVQRFPAALGDVGGQLAFFLVPAARLAA